MKKNSMLILGILLALSCSKSENNSSSEQLPSITGTWVLTSQIEENTTKRLTDCQKKSHIVITEKEYIAYHYFEKKINNENRCVARKDEVKSFQLNKDRIIFDGGNSFGFSTENNTLTISGTRNNINFTETYIKSPSDIDVSKDIETEPKVVVDQRFEKLLGVWHLTSKKLNGEKYDYSTNDPCAIHDEVEYTQESIDGEIHHKIFLRIGNKNKDTDLCNITFFQKIGYTLNKTKIIFDGGKEYEIELIDDNTFLWNSQTDKGVTTLEYKKGYNPNNKVPSLFGKWNLISEQSGDSKEIELNECSKKRFLQISESQLIFAKYYLKDGNCREEKDSWNYCIVQNKIVTYDEFGKATEIPYILNENSLSITFVDGSVWTLKR